MITTIIISIITCIVLILSVLFFPKIKITTAPTKIKYLEIYLSKEMKDLHNENCRTLVKKPKKKQRTKKNFFGQELEEYC